MALCVVVLISGCHEAKMYIGFAYEMLLLTPEAYKRGTNVFRKHWKREAGAQKIVA
jgi:hypothetical protein